MNWLTDLWRYIVDLAYWLGPTLGDVSANTLDLALEAAPWLLLGLIVAGLLKAYLPNRLLQRWIGGPGLGAVARAAAIGAPLPLCSCGVMPAAIGVRRQGASPGATISFLVSTPETGVDSVAVSYALLGPVLAIVRPIAAVISALVAGVTCQFIAVRALPQPGPVGGAAPEGAEEEVATEQCCDHDNRHENADHCCENEPSHQDKQEHAHAETDVKDSLTLAGDCCGGGTVGGSADSSVTASAGHAKANDQSLSVGSCCGSETTGAPHAAAGGSASDGCCGHDHEKATDPQSLRGWPRLRLGLAYAASDLMDEIWVWMLVGIIAAGVVATFMNPEALGSWGSGLPVMLLMLVIGVPMYICATASTPLAAALLLGGLSPGAVLVFLLAGPATNVATLGLVRRELGTPVLAGYLASMAVTTLALGLGTDALVAAADWNIAAQVGQTGKALPLWLAWGCLIALLLLAIRPLRRQVL